MKKDFMTKVGDMHLVDADKVRIAFNILERELGTKQLLKALITMHSVTERVNIFNDLVELEGLDRDVIVEQIIIFIPLKHIIKKSSKNTKQNMKWNTHD